MTLVVKLLFCFYIVYRQKHLSVLAVIYPSLTYIVFPLYPSSTHSAAVGRLCHIFNVQSIKPLQRLRHFILYILYTIEAVKISDCGLDY